MPYIISLNLSPPPLSHHYQLGQSPDLLFPRATLMDGDTAAATSYWCRSHRYRFQAHQAGDCKKTEQQLLPTLPKMHLLSLHQIQTQPYSLWAPLAFIQPTSPDTFRPSCFIAVAFSHAQPRRAHVSYCCQGRGKSLPCPPPSPQPSSPSLADRCCLLPRNSDYVLFGGAEERTEHSWGSFRTTLLNCYACTQCYRK